MVLGENGEKMGMLTKLYRKFSKNTKKRKRTFRDIFVTSPKLPLTPPDDNMINSKWFYPQMVRTQ